MSTITIAMDGPAKNALGTEMMRWLLSRIEAAGDAPILLTGTADVFSAGLNLREVAAHEGDAMLAFLDLLERCMTALYLHPAPVVARIDGHAIAGGCVLALCCDHRVVRDDPTLRIGLNEVALGVRFPPRILSIVRRRVPPRNLEEVVLGAGLFAPRDALRLGLVDEIVDDPAAVAQARLDALARHPRDAYALAKRDLRGTEDDLCPSTEHARLLRALVPTWTSSTVKDRVRAVLKR